jgi:hypothetical protein
MSDFVIRNDTIENDDWMKTLPGYANELAIHDELARKHAGNAVIKYRATVRKGGPESGFHGHAGRPGEVGGSQAASSELSGDQKMAWANAININMYGKLQAVPHGDLLARVINNAPWGSRESFIKSFNEFEELPPKARKTVRSSVEGFLYAIKPIVEKHPGTSLIETRELISATGWGEAELDYMVYGKGANKFFSWEHTSGLNQWRVNSLHYQLDKNNGIVTNSQALHIAVKKLGYRSPEKLYDAMLAIKPVS